MPLFEGVSAFPPTPIDPEGVVDDDLLQRRIDRLAAAGVDSVCVLGSTGGYAYLGREQRQRAIKAAVEAAEGRVPVIAGVGAVTTADVRILARQAEAAGASGALLAPVSYVPLTDEEVFGLVEAADAAAGLPISLYNNPVATRFTFQPPLIARLAALPNVRAIKMPAPADGDFAGEVARLGGGGLKVGYSGDANAIPALSAGAAAWYSISAGLFPRRSMALARAAKAGDLEEARAIAAPLQPLWDIMRVHGGLRTMSAAAGMIGLGDFPPPLPLRPPSGADHEALAETVARLEALEADA